MLFCDWIRELTLDFIFAKDTLLVNHFNLLQLLHWTDDASTCKLSRASRGCCGIWKLLLLRLLRLIDVFKVEAILLHHLRSQVSYKLHVSFFARPHIELIIFVEAVGVRQLTTAHSHAPKTATTCGHYHLLLGVKYLLLLARR